MECLSLSSTYSTGEKAKLDKQSLGKVGLAWPYLIEHDHSLYYFPLNVSNKLYWGGLWFSDRYLPLTNIYKHVAIGLEKISLHTKQTLFAVGTEKRSLGKVSYYPINKFRDFISLFGKFPLLH